MYELLDILNQLAYEETQNRELCFEVRHLYSFANLESNLKKYKTFTIPKKNKKNEPYQRQQPIYIANY